MSESDIGSDSRNENTCTLDRACRKALTAETYCPNDRSFGKSKQRTTSKVLSTLLQLFKGYNLDGTHRINVLIFLEEIKSALDEADIGEAQAKRLV